MREEKFHIYLNDDEYSRLIQSLIRLKNSLTAQGRCTDAVDDEASLNARLSEINIELDKQTENQTDAFQYLSTNHRLYQSIKDYAFGIQREILDGQTGSHETDHIQKANALFFDFENNSFDDGNKVYEMPTCYLSNSNDLHICKSNGIYVDTKSFTPAKLFLTDKRTIDGDISFLWSFMERKDFKQNNRTNRM